MPRGPRGERRPTDVVGAAVRIARISVGEEEDVREPEKATSAAAELGRLGGAARARNLTPEQKRAIGRKGAAKRWGQKKG